MITVAALDPATLSLWYDLSSTGIETRDHVSAAVEATLQGRLDEVARIREDARSEDRGLIVALVSTLWHERRHFVDLALTNYGAIRFRQFLSIYVNLPTILTEARNARVLACPLHAYTDEVRLEVLGIAAPSVQLVQAGHDALKRARYLEQENHQENGQRFGGDAQLEAIAYGIQNTAAVACFGGTAVDELMRYCPRALRTPDVYTWLPRLLPHSELKSPSGVAMRTLGPGTAFLVAALCSGRPSTPGIGSARPIERADSTLGRLIGLVRETDRGRRLPGQTIEKDWQAINEAAQRLWGRTVLDDLREDLALGDGFLVRIEQLHGCDSNTFKIARDFHTLRQCLVGLLINDPGSLLDGPRFVTEVLPRIATLNVLISPRGRPLPAPHGMHPIAGRTYRIGDSRQEAWWCAARPPASPVADPIGLKDFAAWRSVLRFEAPLAKLLVNGRKADCFGPLESIVTSDLAANGIELRIEGTFRRPSFEARSAAALHALRSDSIHCDKCGDRIEEGRGSEIHPWVMHASAERCAAVAAWFKDDPHAEVRADLDWSAWILCDHCLNQLRLDGWIAEVSS